MMHSRAIFTVDMVRNREFFWVLLGSLYRIQAFVVAYSRFGQVLLRVSVDSRI